MNNYVTSSLYSYNCALCKGYVTACGKGKVLGTKVGCTADSNRARIHIAHG